jgi:hypothetical protein
MRRVWILGNWGSKMGKESTPEKLSGSIGTEREKM